LRFVAYLISYDSPYVNPIKWVAVKIMVCHKEASKGESLMNIAELKSLATYQEGFMRYLSEDLADDMPETAQDIREMCDTVKKLVEVIDRQLTR